MNTELEKLEKFKKNSNLKKFSEVFLEKNKVINLISKNDEKVLIEKHIFDSLSIEKFFEKYAKKFLTFRGK